jgi:hypothetical protein
MRALALAILVIGCRHDEPSPHQVTPPAPPTEIVAHPEPAQPVPLADAASPDAAAPDGSDDPDFAFYNGEATIHLSMI